VIIWEVSHMASSRAVEVGDDRAQPRRWIVVAGRQKATTDLQLKLEKMRAGAEPFLVDDGKKAFWDVEWKPKAEHASAMIDSNRKEFYGMRLVAITSAIIVPSLVGLNLAGTGGVAVRWLTFALSLIAALATAIVTLFKFADRWIMYRNLDSLLIGAAWTLINSSPKNAAAWPKFTSDTQAAIAGYDATYQRAVILAAEAKTSGSG
jgi:Protein of unknown function (DUF4231)